MANPLRRATMTSLALDAEALVIARTLARGPKGVGSLISRLLFEERARVEERLQAGKVFLGYYESAEALRQE